MRDPGLELEASSAKQLIEQMESQLGVMTLLLSAVGSISLVVGGIGAPVLGARTAAVIGRGAARLVLDCGNLAYLNSAGLRALFLCARVCREAGVGLAVVPPADHCRTVMEMSGFLSVIECRETVGEAIKALDHPDDLPGDLLDDFPR